VLGDLLGHKNAESTSVYLRLSIDHLRDVALDLPNTAGLIRREEGSQRIAALLFDCGSVHQRLFATDASAG
jgi:hypothetical protein